MSFPAVELGQAESCRGIRGDVGRDVALDTGKGAADVVQDRAQSILLQRELSLE